MSVSKSPTDDCCIFTLGFLCPIHQNTNYKTLYSCVSQSLAWVLSWWLLFLIFSFVLLDDQSGRLGNHRVINTCRDLATRHGRLNIGSQLITSSYHKFWDAHRRSRNFIGTGHKSQWTQLAPPVFCLHRIWRSLCSLRVWTNRISINQPWDKKCEVRFITWSEVREHFLLFSNKSASWPPNSQTSHKLTKWSSSDSLTGPCDWARGCD